MRLWSFGCIVLAVVFSTVLSIGDTATAQSRLPLSNVASWAYQLQGDMAALKQSPHDLLVVDVDNVAWQSNASALSVKPDGLKRPVVSYLSVGEAEDSRPYFETCCKSAKPAWLTERNQGWPGNVAVRFWDPDWQALVAQRIDDLITQGYGGAYLDRLDIYEVMADERPTARADMIAFVAKLAAQARARAPGFVIIVQNAEELLEDPAHLAVIDGIAKEDLFYGIDHDGKRNKPDVIAYAVRDLQRVRASGKPVFVVEYVPFEAAADNVRAEIAAEGFLPLVAGRDLDGK
jgi:cysteinyl-tRNA synthetase, unknown class